MNELDELRLKYAVSEHHLGQCHSWLARVALALELGPEAMQQVIATVSYEHMEHHERERNERERALHKVWQ